MLGREFAKRALPEMQEMIRRRETHVVLSDEGDRYRRSWIPEVPQRVMILIHGYGEHAGRYDEMAMHFARRGFAVHAYDQVGHGRTSGPRGHVDRFDRLPEEVVRFAELVRLEHPGLSTTLVGHSMGGLVVAATAAFLRPEVDRFVVSASLLRLGEGGTGQTLRLLAARCLSAIAPRIGLSVGLDPNGLSRDPDVVRRYREDPFVKDRMTARFAAGLNRLVQRVGANAGRVEAPLMILHGEDDPISPAEGSRDFYAGLSEPVREASCLRVYPGLRHEIFNEPERVQVWQDVLSWIDD